MDDNALVSIIIVNYNGKNHLEECLKSLMQENYKKTEVILIDNNSTDGSIEFVKRNYPSVIIKKLEKNYGFAEPNNIGARIASGDFLLFLNNDTIPKPDFITELIHAIKNDPEITICQSLLLRPDGKIDSSGDFVDTLGRAYSSHDLPKNTRRILSARAASMMVRKKDFFDLGGFDKKFFVSFEDVDIGWRASLWGYKVVVVPKSVVYHKGGETVVGMKKEIQFHGVKNSLIIRLVNFEFFFAGQSVILQFFISFMKKVFGVTVKKDPEPNLSLPSSLIILKGIGWIIKNPRYILAKRKTINFRRKLSTKELIKLGLVTKLS